MPEFETVIGLEVHSQLLTQSKMFCSCESDYQNSSPNTRTCPVCMGMPGVLPVINRKAIELVIKTGLALNCSISEKTKFDRKNYPYPDLMKGYQISQYDMPIAKNGELEVLTDENKTKTIRVERIHLEEDVAKLLHRNDPNGSKYSLLDINRAGIALMEIVTHPDMNSAEEADQYLNSLHAIVRTIGASTANMEDGSFRCDANISTRIKGESNLGKKVEIKNINSFRSVFRAIKYEEIRQQKLLTKGENITQETRGWSDERGTTISQRTKEYASDYRYFPEPDLPPVIISQEWIKEIKSEIPELPLEKKERFINTYKLPEYDANILVSNISSSNFFENTIKQFENITEKTSKSIANWINVEGGRLLNEKNIDVEKSQLTPASLVKLITMLERNELNSNTAKTIFDSIYTSGGDPAEIAQEMGLIQITDSETIESAIDVVLNNNPEAITDYLQGKESVIQFLMGQVMKETKGKANPKMAIPSIKEKLEKFK